MTLTPSELPNGTLCILLHAAAPLPESASAEVLVQVLVVELYETMGLEPAKESQEFRVGSV